MENKTQTFQQPQQQPVDWRRQNPNYPYQQPIQPQPEKKKKGIPMWLRLLVLGLGLVYFAMRYLFKVF